jgi:hypothetical protein
MSVTVSTPANLQLGSIITTTVNVKNTGDKGGYVDLSAYVCKDFYCYSMICDGSRSPRIYVSGKSEYHLSCNAKAEEKGRYRIKVSYSTYGYSDTVYSGFFEILEKPSCEVGYINEFKCSGNWKLQLYKYADCSTAWVYVEYCSEGCYEGQCLPKPTTTTLPTTTTTTLPKPSVEEKALPITGWSTFVSVALPSLLLVFLIPLLILLILRKKKFGKEKPEWFNGDC